MEKKKIEEQMRFEWEYTKLNSFYGASLPKRKWWPI